MHALIFFQQVSAICCSVWLMPTACFFTLISLSLHTVALRRNSLVEVWAPVQVQLSKNRGSSDSGLNVAFALGCSINVMAPPSSNLKRILHCVVLKLKLQPNESAHNLAQNILVFDPVLYYWGHLCLWQVSSFPCVIFSTSKPQILKFTVQAKT